MVLWDNQWHRQALIKLTNSKIEREHSNQQNQKQTGRYKNTHWGNTKDN